MDPTSAIPDRGIAGRSDIDSSTWSGPARSLWAKTDPQTGSTLTLVQHLQDAAAVAGALWDHWLAPNVKRLISQGLPDGESDGRIAVMWLAGIHDVGKASSGFQIKALSAPGFSHLVSRVERHGLACGVRARADRLPPHCRIGQWLVVDWLSSGWSFPPRVAESWATPVGAHHGTPPTHAELTDLAGSRWIGRTDPAWRAVQDQILTEVAIHTGAIDRLAHWAECDRPVTAQALAASVVVVADWLASDVERFPYQLTGLDRLSQAALGPDLLSPWRSAGVPPEAAVLFRQRFPQVGHINHVQAAVVEAARQATEPGLLLLEAPMGSGKTEAALLAAEVLAHRFGAGGVFVALPTMATSDAMFGRVLDWVEHLPDARQSTFLAHGRARLNERYHGLVTQGRIAAVNAHEAADGSDEGSAVVTKWLQGPRKGVLANMVVGTIDQVLFAALKTRHLALRHLALAGKVVIIDEVHAADTYTREYLKRALEWLGAYEVPVILLSATLPPDQREELLAAYASSRTRAVTQEIQPVQRWRKATGAGGPDTAAVAERAAGLAYPMLTVQATGRTVKPIPWEGRRLAVDVRPVSDDLPVLVEAVSALVRDGACVLLGRNTVGRAQEAHDELARALGEDRTWLVHSRFPASERAVREAALIARLGPPSPGRERPHGFVVIGTQVLEQSLDLDADVLFTDVAPLDLVLQRIGRMHRHLRGVGESDRPVSVRRPRVLLTGVQDWAANPPQFASGGVAVYGEAALLRATAVLLPLLDEDAALELPDDIPALVQAAYSDAFVPPPGWQDALAAADANARKERRRALRQAHSYRLAGVRDSTTLVGWLSGRADDEDDGRAQVRDTEDNLEVVLVWQDDRGDVRLPPGMAPHANAPLGLVDYPPEGHLAVAAAASTVRLPQAMTRGSSFDRVLSDLEQRPPHFTGWQQSPWLSGQLVLCLDQHLSADVNGWTLRYSPQTGLSALPPQRGDA